MVAAVAVAVIVFVAGVMVFEVLNKRSNSQTTLLTAKGRIDLIPANESDAIVIHAATPSEVEGNVAILYVVVIYTMNSSEFQHFVKTLNASEHESVAGPFQNLSSYTIKVAVSAGWTYLVFANPDPVQTLIGFNTNLELVPD